MVDERLRRNHLRRLLAELADDADSDFLVGFEGEGVALVAVDAGERVLVDLDFEGLFGTAAGGLSGQGVEALFPSVEFVFVTAAEEDLSGDEVRAGCH